MPLFVVASECGGELELYLRDVPVVQAAVVLTEQPRADAGDFILLRQLDEPVNAVPPEPIALASTHATAVQHITELLGGIGGVPLANGEMA